ncbi:uncharacterized protein LOC127011797 isoform X1 [Drosophila biarmipes]|uniref:uncharacterized protein LOC127011797 isoform X1 n=1 Tax=Drosophila biarmipes TaxID=125945 RepID=UPI0021CC87AD|nr:uncharacterized protein LOC127011797 isoform X1 [Drosophila biarmipes]
MLDCNSQRFHQLSTTIAQQASELLTQGPAKGPLSRPFLAQSGHFGVITPSLPHRKQNQLHSVASQSWNPCSAAPQFQQPGVNGFRPRPRSSTTSMFRCSSTSSGMKASLTRNLLCYSTSTHSSQDSSTDAIPKALLDNLYQLSRWHLLF